MPCLTESRKTEIFMIIEYVGRIRTWNEVIDLSWCEVRGPLVDNSNTD